MEQKACRIIPDGAGGYCDADSIIRREPPREAPDAQDDAEQMPIIERGDGNIDVCASTLAPDAGVYLGTNSGFPPYPRPSREA